MHGEASARIQVFRPDNLGIEPAQAEKSLALTMEVWIVAHPPTMICAKQLPINQDLISVHKKFLAFQRNFIITLENTRMFLAMVFVETCISIFAVWHDDFQLLGYVLEK